MSIAKSTDWVLFDKSKVAQRAGQLITGDSLGIWWRRMSKFQRTSRGLGHGMGSDWCHSDFYSGVVKCIEMMRLVTLMNNINHLVVDFLYTLGLL